MCTNRNYKNLNPDQKQMNHDVATMKEIRKWLVKGRLKNQLKAESSAVTYCTSVMLQNLLISTNKFDKIFTSVSHCS